MLKLEKGEKNKILRTKSEDIKKYSAAELQKLIFEMRDTMYKENGIGLAAPQIGKNIRLFTVGFDYNKKEKFSYFINPKILKKSENMEELEEGCLSVPGLYGKVKRPARVNLEFEDIYGQKHKIKASGLLARVIQHEMDHLDGTLFVDKATKIETKK